ncbi:hypothetical protein DIPPA_02136 [Diplonema papillatum]|nr:hypothetical protein DIPPA_02136 [Diplonema papillatum]
MAASSTDEARWGVDAVLLMHSWASAVQAGFAEREVENRHHAGKTEKQVRKAKLNDNYRDTLPPTPISAADMNFFGCDFSAWMATTYSGMPEDDVVTLGTHFLTAGVFIRIPSGKDGTKAAPVFSNEADSLYQFATHFLRAYRFANFCAEAKPVAAGGQRGKEDLLQRVAAIFWEPPPDASEEENEKTNFIREGNLYFHPRQLDERSQETLLSTALTLCGIVGHITPKKSQPNDETGPPTVHFAKSILAMHKLTGKATPRGLFLLVAGPSTSTDRHIQYVAKEFEAAMQFFQGPLEAVMRRMAAPVFSRWCAHLGAEIQPFVNASSTLLPHVAYTNSQTSVLAYRYGSRCQQSTMRSFYRSRLLVDELMARPRVLGAAVFSEDQTVANEMTEDVLSLVVVARGVYDKKNRGDGNAPWVSLNKDLPYAVEGPNVMLGATLFSYSISTARPEDEKPREGKKKDAKPPEFFHFTPVYLTGPQLHDLQRTARAPTAEPAVESVDALLKYDSADSFLMRDEVPVSSLRNSAPLLPAHLAAVGPDGGRFCGLYLQQCGKITTAVLLPVQDLYRGFVTDPAMRHQITTQMSQIAAQVGLTDDFVTPEPVFALWNGIDRSFTRSRPDDSHFVAECSLAYHIMHGLCDEATTMNLLLSE